MSIRRVDGKKVRTNYAVVELESLRRKDLYFRTALLLPTSRHLSLTFQLLIDDTIIQMDGELLSIGGDLASYTYHAEYTISDRALSLFRYTVNKIAERSDPFLMKALDAYNHYHIYNHCNPQIDFQT